ncbi:MAG: hypothetical protein SGPRY_006059, partial [Prymnesium sp.]
GRWGGVSGTVGPGSGASGGWTAPRRPHGGRGRRGGDTTFSAVSGFFSGSLMRFAAIMFLDAVSALKEELDVPAGTVLPTAFHQMSMLMGLSVYDKDGAAISLPVQVESLVKATGMKISTGSDEGLDQAENAASTQPKLSAAERKRPLQQGALK